MAKYAVVLGANGRSWVSSLRYAESDAKRLAEILALDHCGYEVTLIPPEATSASALGQIDAVATKCTHDDTFLIHCSCHGEVIRSQLYFILNGTDFNNIQATGLLSQRVLDAFRQSRANNKLLILDCCRAGAALGATPRYGVEVKFEDLVPSENHQILFASDRFEDAYEFDHLGAGFLASTLSAALAWDFAKADEDKDGTLSTDDLRSWIEDRANAFNKRGKHRVPIPYWTSTKRKGTFALANRPGTQAVLPKRPTVQLLPYLRYLLLDRRTAVTLSVLAVLGVIFLWILAWGPDAVSRRVVHRYTQEKKVIVGCKRYPEQEMLLELLAAAIEKGNPEITVERRFDYKRGETTDVFFGLVDGDLDVYVEYTGTLLSQIFERPANEVRDPAAHDAAAIQALVSANSTTEDLLWEKALGFNNTYVLTMLRQRAEDLGILGPDGTGTISDLAEVSRKLTLKSETQFQSRPDGLPGLEREYKLYFAETEYIRHRNKYEALEEGQADVVPGYSTDPELFLDDQRFVALVDDRGFFPAYYASPFLRGELTDHLPNVVRSIEKLSGRVSEAEISALIQEMGTAGIIQADLKTSEIARGHLNQIALRFLRHKGMILP